MFSTIVLIILPVVSLAQDAEPPGGYYTTRYDHVDIENILNQKRLVHYYAACLLDKGPCTPQGTEFKSILPEAIKTNCLRCTEKQRVVTTRAIRRLQKEYPDVWSKLEEKWDPTGENVKRLLSSVNRPRPIAPTVPLISDKFGGVEDEEISERPSASETSTTKASTTGLPSSTLMNALVTKTSVIQSTTSTSTIASTKQTTTTARTIAFRPFNSIGPNLIVPNPKVLLNKVIQTAGIVFNSVLKG